MLYTGLSADSQYDATHDLWGYNLVYIDFILSCVKCYEPCSLYYVHFSVLFQGELSSNHRIIIDGPPSLPGRARFGSSLASLEDMDRDGYMGEFVPNEI